MVSVPPGGKRTGGRTRKAISPEAKDFAEGWCLLDLVAYDYVGIPFYSSLVHVATRGVNGVSVVVVKKKVTRSAETL
jgi:hypothetical protein